MRKSKDLIPVLILLVFATFAYTQTFYFMEASTWSMAPTDRFSPTGATWPRIVLYAIFFLLGLLFLSSILKKPPIGKEKTAEEEAEGKKNPRAAIVFVLILFSYLFLMEILGFPLDTILFGFIFCFTIGRKELKVGKGCLLYFISSILIAVTFSRYLYIPLPKGIWIFRDLSVFIMF